MANNNRWGWSALSKNRYQDAYNEEVMIDKKTGEIVIKRADGVIVSYDHMARTQSAMDRLENFIEGHGESRGLTFVSLVNNDKPFPIHTKVGDDGWTTINKNGETLNIFKVMGYLNPESLTNAKDLVTSLYLQPVTGARIYGYIDVEIIKPNGSTTLHASERGLLADNSILINATDTENTIFDSWHNVLIRTDFDTSIHKRYMESTSLLDIGIVVPDNDIEIVIHNILFAGVGHSGPLTDKGFQS